jgi:hypothetical protein
MLNNSVGITSPEWSSITFVVITSLPHKTQFPLILEDKDNKKKSDT